MFSAWLCAVGYSSELTTLLPVTGKKPLILMGVVSACFKNKTKTFFYTFVHTWWFRRLIFNPFHSLQLIQGRRGLQLIIVLRKLKFNSNYRLYLASGRGGGCKACESRYQRKERFACFFCLTLTCGAMNLLGEYEQLVHVLSSADVARRLVFIAKRDKWQFVVKTWG